MKRLLYIISIMFLTILRLITKENKIYLTFIRTCECLAKSKKFLNIIYQHWEYEYFVVIHLCHYPNTSKQTNPCIHTVKYGYS